MKKTRKRKTKETSEKCCRGTHSKRKKTWCHFCRRKRWSILKVFVDLCPPPPLAWSIWNRERFPPCPRRQGHFPAAENEGQRENDELPNGWSPRQQWNLWGVPGSLIPPPSLIIFVWRKRSLCPYVARVNFFLLFSVHYHVL